MEELKKFIETKIIPIKSKSGYEYKYSYWQKHFPEELNKVLSLTSFLDNQYSKIPLKQRIWHILNNKLELQYCPVCKQNLLKWNQNNYRLFCSLKCQSKSNIVKEKRKQTNLKKYGVENTFKLVDYSKKDYKQIKEKREKTLFEKYGVKAFSQTKLWKEKTKQTNLRKYGVEHIMKNEEIKNKVIEKMKQNTKRIDKIKQTNLQRYGVEFPLQSEKIREKIKQTNLKKYGVEYITQTKKFKEMLSKNNPMFFDENKEKIKQTNLKRYGVEFPLQNKEIKEKFK